MPSKTQAANVSPGAAMRTVASAKGVRRQSIWDSRVDKLSECLAHLGFHIRQQLCGVASASIVILCCGSSFCGKAP
jgi:hypothetical protein